MRVVTTLVTSGDKFLDSQDLVATGNDNDNSGYVHCGFKPKMVMILNVTDNDSNYVGICMIPLEQHLRTVLITRYFWHFTIMVRIILVVQTISTFMQMVLNQHLTLLLVKDSTKAKTRIKNYFTLHGQSNHLRMPTLDK